MLLWPTGIVPEGFPPITLNPVPVNVACDIATDAVPVFVTVTLCIVMLPTATLPKLKLVALAVSTPAPGSPGVVFAALVYAAQLERPTIARTMASVVKRTMYLGERAGVASGCGIESGMLRALLSAWVLMSRSSVGSEGGAPLLVRGTEMVQVSSPVQLVYRVPDHRACTGAFSSLVRATYYGVLGSYTCTAKSVRAKARWGFAVN